MPRRRLRARAHRRADPATGSRLWPGRRGGALDGRSFDAAVSGAERRRRGARRGPLGDLRCLEGLDPKDPIVGPPFECVAMNEVSRRDTLKLLAAGGAGAACTPRQPSEENMSEKHRLQASAGDPALSPTSENPILRTRPLPRLGPWPTPDPFLFCVHHLDHYPAGNERLGPAVSLSGRNIGQDFEGKDGWNM